MNGKDLLIVVICAAVGAVAVIVPLKLFNVQTSAAVGGGVGGAVAGAVIAILAARKRRQNAGNPSGSV